MSKAQSVVFGYLSRNPSFQKDEPLDPFRNLKLIEASYLKALGDYESISKFASKYGCLKTRVHYLGGLKAYFEWLKKNRISLDPDQLAKQNRENAYDRRSTARKFEHRDWLDRFCNRDLLIRGASESRRKQISTAVRMFYYWNDSEIQGAFRVASSDGPRRPRGIKIQDVRLVLSALPIPQRLPLLCELVSGTNIGTILAWRWGQLDLANGPMRIDYSGRKTSRKPYFCLYSTEAVELLRVWKGLWKGRMGRTPTDDDYVFVWRGGRFIERGWLNTRMREMAEALRNEGLITSDPAHFTSHALRACFRTEASREEVGMPAGIRNFLMGWKGGVSSLYDNTDEVRPEAIYRAYVKLEPYLSLTSRPKEAKSMEPQPELHAQPAEWGREGVQPAGIR